MKPPAVARSNGRASGHQHTQYHIVQGTGSCAQFIIIIALNLFRQAEIDRGRHSLYKHVCPAASPVQHSIIEPIMCGCLTHQFCFQLLDGSTVAGWFWSHAHAVAAVGMVVQHTICSAEAQHRQAHMNTRSDASAPCS